MHEVYTMRLTVDDIEKIERVANKIILLTEAGEPITECIEICTKKERSGNVNHRQSGFL